jgi:hypothetical protein
MKDYYSFEAKVLELARKKKPSRSRSSSSKSNDEERGFSYRMPRPSRYDIRPVRERL